MTDAQLYLAIGIPSFIGLKGILVNTCLYIHVNTSLDEGISDLNRKWEAKFAGSVTHGDSRFDLLVGGKIADMDLTLPRLENKVEHLERS